MRLASKVQSSGRCAANTRHLASLARVLQHVGRPAKTIHLTVEA
jgi:hypothetical protein